MNSATITHFPNTIYSPYYSPILYHQHTYPEDPYYPPYYPEHQSSSSPWYHHKPYQTPITNIDFEQRDQMRMIIEQKLGLLFDPMDWCVHFDEVMEMLLERYPELRDDLSSPSPLPPSTAPLVFDEMPVKAVETLWYQTPPPTTTTMLQTSPYTITTIPPNPHDWQTPHKINQSPLTINTMETPLQAPTESTPDFIDLITNKEEKRCCKESEELQGEEFEFGQAKTEIQYDFTTIGESSELENSMDQFNKDTHQCDMEESNQNGSDFHVLAASKVSLPLTLQISAPILPPLSSESPPQCSLSILPSITTTRYSKPIEKSIENTIIHHTHKLFDSIAEPTVSHHSKLIQVYCSDDPHHYCYPIIYPHLRPPSQPPDTSLVCKPPQISKRPPIIRPPPPQCLHQPKFPNHVRSVPLEFQKVEIALIHHDRDVVPWWYQTKFLGHIWQMFVEILLQQFESRECVNFSSALSKIRPKTSIDTYEIELLPLVRRTHEWMDDRMTRYFTAGLHDKLCHERFFVHQALLSKCMAKSTDQMQYQGRKFIVDYMDDRLLVLVSIGMLGGTWKECHCDHLWASYYIWFHELLSHIQPPDDYHFVNLNSCTLISELFRRLGGYLSNEKCEISHARKIVQSMLKLLNQGSSKAVGEEAINLSCTILAFFLSSTHQYYEIAQGAIVSKSKSGKNSESTLMKLAHCLYKKMHPSYEVQSIGTQQLGFLSDEKSYDVMAEVQLNPKNFKKLSSIMELMRSQTNWFLGYSDMLLLQYYVGVIEMAKDFILQLGMTLSRYTIISLVANLAANEKFGMEVTMLEHIHVWVMLVQSCKSQRIEGQVAHTLVYFNAFVGRRADIFEALMQLTQAPSWSWWIIMKASFFKGSQEKVQPC